MLVLAFVCVSSLGDEVGREMIQPALFVLGEI